jgi:hypothetical protein
MQTRGEATKSQANFVFAQSAVVMSYSCAMTPTRGRSRRSSGVVSGLVRETPVIQPITSETKVEKTMANLRIILSNDRPIREEKYPRTRLLYNDKDIIEVHVTHDSHNRLFVLDKGAASSPA